MKPVALTLVVLALHQLGCAPRLQQPAIDAEIVRQEDAALLEEALALSVQRWSTVMTVSHRLRTRAVALCRDQVAPTLGLIAVRNRDFPRRFRDTQARLYGSGDGVVVVDLLADGPAATAGLRRGDRILAVNGRRIESHHDLPDALREQGGKAVELEFERGGVVSARGVAPVLGCSQEAEVSFGGGVEVAVARNGKDVVVGTELVSFVRSDDELALAISRSMARVLIGGDADDDGKRYAEADRLGLQLAASAGFDVSLAPAFWDRVASWHPSEVYCDPGREACRPPAGRYAERSLVIRATTRELSGSPGGGGPLAP